jgi:hypothetical protein
VILWLSLVRLGVVVCQKVSIFHRLAHLSLGVHPLGEIFTLGIFPFVNTSGPRGFFPRTKLGIFSWRVHIYP